MKKYLIAGHIIAVDDLLPETEQALCAYRYTGSLDAEKVFSISQEDLKSAQEEWLESYRQEIEDFILSQRFCMWLATQNGIYLHASAVAYQGFAYLFTADCGTGKSTHARLWKQAFGAEQVDILNDDKPFVCCKDGVFYACGSPWCGKERLQTNRMVPVAGLCFLRQGKTNEIAPFEPSMATPLLLRQTLLPEGEKEMDMLLTLVDRLLKTVPLFSMSCNISEDAARMAFEAMKPASVEDAHED